MCSAPQYPQVLGAKPVSDQRYYVVKEQQAFRAVDACTRKERASERESTRKREREVESGRVGERERERAREREREREKERVTQGVSNRERARIALRHDYCLLHDTNDSLAACTITGADHKKGTRVRSCHSVRPQPHVV